ncbi:hypothetical protein ACVXG9_11330 [Escherichia coli]
MGWSAQLCVLMLMAHWQQVFSEALGSALTHKWITTDFAEALFEFITPVDGDLEHMLTFMCDLHGSTARNMVMSGCGRLRCHADIEKVLGTSKGSTALLTPDALTLYREGLKNRYGALMQTISGVHYNFSLPMAFWHEVR